jgi:hypothetical protein
MYGLHVRSTHAVVRSIVLNQPAGSCSEQGGREVESEFVVFTEGTKADHADHHQFLEQPTSTPRALFATMPQQIAEHCRFRLKQQ